MKVVLFALLFTIQMSFAIESFRCTPLKDEGVLEYTLYAVYINDALRGSLYMDYYVKDCEGVREKVHSYVTARYHGIPIKSVEVVENINCRENTNKTKSKRNFVELRAVRFFYMNLTKEELEAIRKTDRDGVSCLDIITETE